MHMETMERMPFKGNNMIFGRLKEVSNLNALSRQERLNYEESLKVYRDNMAILSYAFEQGFKQGYEQGFKQGYEQWIKEGSAETLSANIRNMRNAGLDNPTIAKYLGLSVEEILSHS